MAKEYSVKLSTIIDDLRLENAWVPDTIEEILITSADVNRPGLQLAGFFDYFDPRRMQILGKVETNYLKKLSDDKYDESLEGLFSKCPVTVIVCHGMEVPELMIEKAKKYEVPLLVSDMDTSEFMSQLIGMLRTYLAPRMTMHGVLVEVHGEGMLITGESGIGKSETALELVKRGHRLIADDAVEIKRTARTVLVGSAPEMIRYLMELRGIGVVDVKNIYGVGAVKPMERIDMVVSLEAWDTEKFYDRLGVETEYTEIFGVSVPKITIPVRPGRNLAVILELAAMNNRRKKMGENDALNLVLRHDQSVDMGWMSI